MEPLGIGLLVAIAILLDLVAVVTLRALRAPRHPPAPQTVAPMDAPHMSAAPSHSTGPGRSFAGKRLTALGSLAAGVATLGLAATLVQVTPHRTINLLLAILGTALTSVGLTSLLSDGGWGWLNVGARRLGVRPVQLPLGILGVALALAARSAAGDGERAHLPIHGWLWASGVAFVVAGLWSAGERYPRPRRSRSMLLGAAGLLAVSLAARAIDLNGIPYILGGDEGSLGLTAQQFITGARDNLLAAGWFSWPALHAWIVSRSQAVLGPTVAAIRWPSAVAGMLTVLATLWMARGMFGPRLGWLSAMALSASHVHLLFSRVAMNNVFDGLLLTTAIGGLWVAWSHNRRWAFLLTGLAVGLSPYFYATGRLLPLLLLAWIPFLHRARSWRTRAPGLTAMAVTASVTALPITLFNLARPEEFLAPLTRVSVFNSVWLEANGLGTSPTVGLIAREFSTTLLGFIARPLEGVYFPGIPYLDPLSAAFFLGGLALALLRIRRPQYAIVPVVVLATALTGAFSLGAPSSQRLVFAAPILALCAALPIDAAMAWARARKPRLGQPLSGLAVLAFLAACLYQAWFFFGQAMPLARYSDVQGLVATELGRTLQRYPEGTPVYFVRPGPMGFSTVPSLAYLAPHVHGQDLDWPAPTPSPPPASGVPMLWVTLPEQAGILAELEAEYPQSRTVRWVDAAGQPLFNLLEVLDFRAPRLGGAFSPAMTPRESG